jgi:hypothetical protein
VTASVTTGRALRYTEGSARGLLHQLPGHDPQALAGAMQDVSSPVSFEMQISSRKALAGRGRPTPNPRHVNPNATETVGRTILMRIFSTMIHDHGFFTINEMNIKVLYQRIPIKIRMFWTR